MKTIKLETCAGDSFDKVAASAKLMAISFSSIVEFDFNGVKCLVSENTNPEWLYRDYSNSWTMQGQKSGPFGPKKGADLNVLAPKQR